MKKSILLYAIALISISFNVQAQNDIISISGSIQNKKLDKIGILSKDFTSYVKEINLDEHGKFKDTLKAEEGVYVFFDGAALASIYLKPGNKIIVNVDSKDFENTLTYIGDGSEISTGVNNYEIAKKKLSNASNTIYELSEEAFKVELKQFNLKLEQTLMAFNAIPIDIKNKEKQNLQYESLVKIGYYEIMHARTTKNLDFKVSNGFYDELKALDYDNENDFITFKSYQTLVSQHYNRKAVVLSKKEGIHEYLAKIEVIRKISNEHIKNTLLYNNASSELSKSEDFTVYYNAFMKASTNKEHKDAITEAYKSLTVLKKGEAAPKFVNYENHAGGTTSLDDLKGKYVYIDVWATWCGPCKAEIPFLQEVEKEYHGKNIEFVSISTDRDKDRDKWKKMVVEMNLGGIQLLASDKFSSKFLADYVISGIPRFILIDPNGNIVTANAPRPSQHELKTLFNSLDI